MVEADLSRSGGGFITAVPGQNEAAQVEESKQQVAIRNTLDDSDDYQSSQDEDEREED